jgi:hypothetical protein
MCCVSVALIKRRVREKLRLCSALGGKVMTSESHDLSFCILDFAFCNLVVLSVIIQLTDYANHQVPLSLLICYATINIIQLTDYANHQVIA